MNAIQICPKCSDVKPTGFYVYLHRKATDGSCFYVGKGSAKRAWILSGRSNPKWRRTALKYGVICEVCCDNLSEDNANLLEMWLIAKLRHEGVDLSNLTDGGEGASGWVPGLKWREDRRALMLSEKNPFRGRVMTDSERKHISETRIASGIAKGENNPRFGVSLDQVTKDKIALSLSDKRVILFHHDLYGFEKCTIYELRMKYNLVNSNLHAMVKGKYMTHKGWRLA